MRSECGILPHSKAMNSSHQVKGNPESLKGGALGNVLVDVEIFAIPQCGVIMAI
jgi:hypothetical protein